MSRWYMLLVALLLGVSACGGDGDDGSADGLQGEAVAQDGGSDEAVTTTAVAAATDDGGAAEGSGPSTATVTLGDQTYEFSTEGAAIAQCQTDLFGVFSAQLPMVGGDGNLSLVALHPDTDPAVVGRFSSATVTVDGEDWVADEADMVLQQAGLDAGSSRVDAVEFDGRTVRGSATFYRLNSAFTDELETITGTFEATCGEERVS